MGFLFFEPRRATRQDPKQHLNRMPRPPPPPAAAQMLDIGKRGSHDDRLFGFPITSPVFRLRTWISNSIQAQLQRCLSRA